MTTTKQALADGILKRIAERYKNCSIHIYPEFPELSPVEAVLRCAQEEGFTLRQEVPHLPRHGTLENRRRAERIKAIREREQKHLNMAPASQISQDTLWLIEQVEAFPDMRYANLQLLAQQYEDQINEIQEICLEAGLEPGEDTKTIIEAVRKLGERRCGVPIVAAEPVGMMTADGVEWYTGVEPNTFLFTHHWTPEQIAEGKHKAAAARGECPHKSQHVKEFRCPACGVIES
jgi:hypothetical protein